MWKTLNSFWFLVIFLNQKAAGYFYHRLKSREGSYCKPRLTSLVYGKFCKYTPCITIKDCTNPKHSCICDENCGRICVDPISSCTSGWCLNGGTCEIVNGSSQCSCPSNFTGKRCDVDVDECTTLSQPCKNGGTCTNIIGGYYCRCITGWEGSDCSINIDECKTDDGYPVCQHGGTCVDRVGSYKCVCPPGKTGLICQFDDKCAANPCSGNATCLTSPFGEAICMCSSGWTGSNCDIDVQDCNTERSPCGNGGKCRDIPGSYVCDCAPGFAGSRCEQNIDECASSPCKNGICLDYYNKFQCACNVGWTGRLCEKELNECDSKPCMNGGQCHDRMGNYSCTCLNGYEGRNCEIDINECASSPCKNGATCQDGIGKYTCSCLAGFAGTNCQINIDECQSMPCQNMGSCIDGINGYSCKCHDGYAGQNCEINIDECASSPCRSGATCEDKVNGYRCLCPSGASGQHCENDPNDCPPNACKNGGQCIDGINSYTCKCHPGFTGALCDIQIKYCSSSPCKNGAACIDGIAEYRCHCPTGYTGRNCGTAIDSCVGHSCRNGASCVSVSAYSYTCTCPPGYSGQYCEEDVNECASKPCISGTCVDGVNKYICRCNPGFMGANCHLNIDDCQSSPCVHGGTCVDGINKYTCKCPNGFSGSRCEIHLDECRSYPCKHGGTCIDKIGSYECYCPPGYTGSNCQYPKNRCQNNPCQNGATCQRTGVDSSDFRCLCKREYRGTICDVEEVSCAAAGTSCKNGGTCVDDAKGIQSCKCQKGFSGSYCETNINDCANGPCKYGATCTDLVANYTCTCQKGFTGRNCDTNINECASNPCVRGTCKDLVNGYLCDCPKGYVGARCEINPNDCFSNACFNGGTCKDGISSYQCSCKAGYTGSRCEIDFDECSSSPCSGIGTEKCYNLVNSYHCECKRGFLGKQCEININECLSYPCLNGGSCKDGAGSFTCLCPQGFSGMNCERRVYSCRDSPCENGGTCFNYKGSYNCTCNPGVYGIHCEWNKDDCLSDPCQNGGTCVDGFRSFTCKCQLGYTGNRCQTSVNECQSQPCQNGGKCRDLIGGYKCDCPAKLVGKNCEVLVKEVCPYKDCAKSFDGGRCVHKCNNYECNWDGTTCSLGIKPWSNCTTITKSGKACYEVFKNGHCDKECNTGSCLMDGFDCKKPTPSCPYNAYCSKRFADTRCDKVCNIPGCLDDGLDCNVNAPKKVDGTLVIVLLVTPKSFLNGSRKFMRELSRVLNTIAFVKKDENDRPIVKPFPLPPSAPVPVDRKRRSAEGIFYIGMDHFRSGRYKRESNEKNGAEVHVEMDNRACTANCFKSADNAARYLGARASNEDLPLPYSVYSVQSQDKPTEKPDTSFKPSPLWIAILCVGIPLFIVGVLAGGKRMYTKLWLPEGFPPRLIHQRRSMRREPVGQEVSMRSMNKSSTNLEEGAVGGGTISRSDLTPPSEARDAKIVKLDDDCKKISSVEKDTRKWTRLHKEAADVNVRNCSILTPPQEGERGVDNNVDARGPGGFTALHLASCRGTLLDGCIDDDKDSDDSGGVMVSDLLSLGASYGAKTDESQETPLHLAARYSRADAAKRLLDAGADPNAKDRLGRTPLHLAVGSDAQGVFQILLRNRATDLEAQMDDGTSPLILAARFDLVDIVRDLIKAGAKVNNTDYKGKSALHWAASVNSHDVTAELTKNGAKKDLQDEKGQTPLFLGAREGSLEAVRILLVNYANRNIADNMDKTPEGIARQKMHHDIVQLLTDWSLGCGNSPKAAPAPTSPPDHKSPINGTTSPPCMEHLQNANSVVTHFPLTTSTRPKMSSTSSNNARGARSKTSVNGGSKRKRRRPPRKDEEANTDSSSSSSNTRKPSDGAVVYSPPEKLHSPCSSGATFSPNCVSSIANGFSPQGSSGTGISPSNSTTLSPPQDTGSPPVFTDSPFDDVLGDNYDLDEFRGIDFDDITLNDTELSTDFGPADCCVVPDTLSMSCMLPTTVTTIGDEINKTSDCMYHSTRPQRRDYNSGLRLSTAQSSPNLHCAIDNEPRRLTIVQDRNDITTQRISNGYPSNHGVIQVCAMSNGMVHTSRKDSYNHNQYYRHMQQHPSNPVYNENYSTPSSVHSFTPYDSSPQKIPGSYLTPSPDSPEEGWSSSPHSLSSDWSC